MATTAFITDMTVQDGIYLARLLMATLAMVRPRIGGTLPPGLTL
jgi:hypothetical protein